MDFYESGRIRYQVSGIRALMSGAVLFTILLVLAGGAAVNG